MMALIKSQEMLWASPFGRWIHPMELLAMQGFPVFECMQGSGYNCCSFNGDSNISRTRNSVTCESGNSMHVSVVAAMWIFVSLFFERDNAEENGLCKWLSMHDVTLHGESL